MCEHARSDLIGNYVVEGKGARLGRLRSLCKDGAEFAVVMYVCQYANRTDRGCARTHSCDIRYFSALRIQVEKIA
jgi:hypothetical protein